MNTRYYSPFTPPLNTINNTIVRKGNDTNTGIDNDSRYSTMYNRYIGRIENNNKQHVKEQLDSIMRHDSSKIHTNKMYAHII